MTTPAVTTPPDAAVLASEGLTDINGGRSTLHYLRSMWRLRHFVHVAALGQLRAQNQNTLLGSLWHVLRPLMHAFVFFIVFGVLFDARREVDNYLAFLLIGMFVFTYTTRAMTGGAGSVVANQRLMQSVAFPRALLPVSSALVETIAQLPVIAVMVVMVLLTGEPPSFWWVALVPALVLQAMFNLGMAFVTSRMTFHFRDVQQFLPYLLQLWMYLSGLFFTVDYVSARAPHWMVVLFRLNPLYSYMQIFRGVLMEGRIYPNTWVIAIGWAVVALGFGFFFFKARDHAYAHA